MKKLLGFGSDNHSGVHSDILTALQKANKDYAGAYGNDEYTFRAKEKFRQHFGKDTEVFFVYNGTGANVLGLTAVTDSFNTVFCAETAHLNVDECGAPEKFTGCKLVPIPTKNGKIAKEQLESQVHGFGDPHHSQPKIISITQPTEYGTVYTPEEIKDLSCFAHSHNMLLHMDGARLSNAAVFLNRTFKEITTDVAVDVVSFGGTKNGMMFGEAVVFIQKHFAENFEFIRKQGMQLASKMRFISAQFEAYLSNDLCFRNAMHANQMAQLLAKRLHTIPAVEITQNVESNAVFSKVPGHHISSLQDRALFYIWNEHISEVRYMCSFETTEDEIDQFWHIVNQTLI